MISLAHELFMSEYYTLTLRIYAKNIILKDSSINVFFWFTNLKKLSFQSISQVKVN